MDGGPWWAAVHAVVKSQTQLSDFSFTFHFHALEKEMATHSSVLAWRIPGTGEPGGLPSMGSQRVGHDWSDLAAAAAMLDVNYYGFHIVSRVYTISVASLLMLTLIIWLRWYLSGVLNLLFSLSIVYSLERSYSPHLRSNWFSPSFSMRLFYITYITLRFFCHGLHTISGPPAF